MGFDLESIVRENVRNLVPYSSARSEFSGDARVFLDANENSFGSPVGRGYNRYPDPVQSKLKEIIADINDLGTNNIFIGNGSDEAIDLVIRIFCRPRIDNVLICPPTYGMYEVSAAINDVEVKRANLTRDFQLDVDAIKTAVDVNTRLIFICSPNNPTGNCMRRNTILRIASLFRGIVVVDEAYTHFSKQQSLIDELDRFPNLVVLQTFSKAWGLAGVRVGLAFADKRIIDLFNKVKPPYNVSQVAQEVIIAALEKRSEVAQTAAEIVMEREVLRTVLRRFTFVKKIYPSDANFLLVKVTNATELYKYLLNEQIVVRDRSNIELCEDCLRITIGKTSEDRALLQALKKYEKSVVH